MSTDVNDRRTHTFVVTGIFYLASLLLIVAAGAIVFRSLYQDPPRLAGITAEDARIKAFDTHYGDAYGNYHRFVQPAGFALAAYLAVWTALFGLWKGKFWYGIAALTAGTAATVLALSLLPWMHFPLDRYPISALWVIGNVFPLAITWIVATLLGRRLIGRFQPNGR